MAEKTYTVVVAHEAMKVGQKVTTEPTPRMEALLGAGYYHASDISWPMPVAEPVADWVDDAGDTELLERFEDLDVVEVVAAKPKRRRNVEQ